ncbi:hypothetical protein [Mucilaginibacter sp.]|jgi:hypothetical protein|uniref:hypothetical protein n=1 Tax=Mucilaginibacter sp. TaxID=1882438 RepID=UPI0035618D55
MKFKTRVVVLGALQIFSLNVFSQCTGDPNDPGIPIDPEDPPCYVPLDNWLHVLVIVAIIFGAYHLYKKHKALSA